MANNGLHNCGWASLVWGLLICLLSSGTLYAQSSNWKKAQRLLSDYSDYEGAIELYKKDLDKKPSVESSLGMANCYRDLNNPAEAELWYRKALEFANCDPVAHLYLAEMLLNRGEYDEARDHLLEYKATPHASPYAVQKLLAICDTGYYWTQEAIPGTLKNEASLNSPRDDWGPAPYRDGIIFNTKHTVDMPSPYELDDRHFLRTTTAKFDTENGGFTDIKAFGRPINGNFHAGPATFFKDDSYIVFVRTIANPDLPRGGRIMAKNNPGIFMSERMRDGSFGDIIAFPYNDIIQYGTGAPYLSANDHVLYFASNCPGGYGGYDIYYSVRRPDFTWGDPVNCGPAINTSGDELFPVVGSDGNFYFSANGRPGMGGLDIFVTKGSQNSWQTPVNMGYPINSGADDYYPMILSGDKILFSSNRAGGLGGSDIYSFTYDRTQAPAYRTERATLVAEQAEAESLSAEETGLDAAVEEEPDPQVPVYDEPYPTINTSKPSQAFVPSATPAVDQSNTPGIEAQSKQKADPKLKRDKQEVKLSELSVAYEEPAVEDDQEDIGMEEVSATSAEQGEEDAKEDAAEEAEEQKLLDDDQRKAGEHKVVEEQRKLDEQHRAEEQKKAEREAQREEKVQPATVTVATPTPAPVAVQQPQTVEEQGWLALNIETVDKHTRTALANTQLRMVDDGTGKSVRFRTDARGTLVIEIMVGVPYTLSASRPSYGNAAISFTITSASKKIIARLGLEPLYLNRDIRIPNLYYDVDSWAVKATAEEELDKLVAILNSNPRLQVDIKSYANDKVKATDNVELSHRRARAIYNYLAYKGVEEDRITAKGYGTYTPADGAEQRYRVTYRLYSEGSTSASVAKKSTSSSAAKKAITTSRPSSTATTKKVTTPAPVKSTAPTATQKKRKEFTGKDDPEKNAPAEFSVQGR
ncbi:MAG: OmpA family protein [Prevotellaceae bacterium]|jgi:outer membrane protein OmpA-like peptidoglycan-associated protein|nr:OmpA family protein [Prevotellaceae bacterium]